MASTTTPTQNSSATDDEDDPVQAAMKEADSMIDDIGSDGNFAIDSDDEDDITPSSAKQSASDNKQTTAETPTPTPKQASASQQEQEKEQQNQNPRQQQRRVPGSVQPGAAATAAATSLFNSMSALAVRASAATSPVSNSVPATMATPPPPPPAPPNTPAVVSQHTPGGSSTSGATPTTNPSSSSGAPSLDVFKAQTSRFASNIANIAQRAATQVASSPLMSTSIPPTPQHGAAHPGPGMTTTHQQHTATVVPQVEIDNEQKTKLIKTHVGTLLPGESVIMFLTNLLHVSDSTGFQYSYSAHPSTMWCCAMTYYRLILFGTNDIVPAARPADWNSSCWPSESSVPSPILQMPLASMDKVEKSVFTASADGIGSNPTTLMGLLIHGKDNGRQLRFTTPNYGDTMRAHEALQNYAFPGRRNLGYLFAFESKRSEVMASVKTDPATGKKMVTLEPLRKRFDAVKEYQRQFARGGGDTASSKNDPNSRPWSIWTTINQSYQICGSYPSVLVGPAAMDENNPEAQRIIRQCAAFRSENRLPSLTWSSGVDGASLWRGSQPRVGLQGTRSSADELMLKQIMESANAANILAANSNLTPEKSPRTNGFMSISPSMVATLTGCFDAQHWMPEPTCGLKIMDLRPRSAAVANRTSGYGYENTSHYPGTTLQFCNIGNIHAVRDSYHRLSTLCQSPTASDLQWNGLVEDTKWLSHIRTLLAAGWEAAFWAHVHRLPVFMRCSHGWDRACQVAIVAQLILDDHFRTLEGFATLVEKDFMSFGHPFHLRCAHGEGRGTDGGGGAASSAGGGSGAAGSGNSPADEGQISPIFMQFLDCIYQIVRQYPECFEFNTKYLLILSEHVYSCRFGNFLCDTEREREHAAGVRQRTHSIWDYLEGREDTINRRFDKSKGGKGVMLMPLPTLLRNVTLWKDRHLMHSPKSATRWLPEGISRPRYDDVANDQQGKLITVEENERLLNSVTAVDDVAVAAPCSSSKDEQADLQLKDPADGGVGATEGA